MNNSPAGQSTSRNTSYQHQLSSDNTMNLDVDQPPSYETALSMSTNSSYANTNQDQSVDPTTTGIVSYGVSIYPFQGEFASELTFKPNEVIHLIRHVDSDWMEGEVNGMIGIFPKSFIKIIVDVHDAENGDHPTANQDQQFTDYPHDTYARVLHDYESEFEGTLSLKAGDTLTLLRKIDDDWVEGMDDNDKIGFFPLNFLEMITESSASGLNRQDTVESHHEDGKSWIGSKAKAVADFPAAVEGDLELAEGTVVTILKSVNHEWVEAQAADGRTGLCPLTFLEIMDPNSSDHTFDNLWILENMASGHNASNVSADDLLNVDTEFSPRVTSSKRASAESGQNDSLDSGHPERSVPSPSNFSLQNIVISRTQHPSRPAPLPPVPIPESISASAIREKQAKNPADFTLPDLNPSPPEVQPGALASACAAAGGFDPEREERKRLKMIEQRSTILTELLQSEKDYLDDLKICEMVLEKGIHMNSDIKAMVGNLKDVISVNSTLNLMLERDIRQNDGSGVAKCFLTLKDVMMKSYSIYCRNSDEIQVIWNRLLKCSDQNVKKVIENAVDKIKAETNCLDLPSVLIKPVQRILKYPLLLSELIKCSGNPTETTELKEALNMMTDMASDINEFKRRKDLVQKYRRQESSRAGSSLASKISKLTIHSVKKKSSRFGLRLSSTFGLTSATRDEKFESILNKFQSVEKTIKIYLKDLLLTMEYYELFVLNFHQLILSLEAFYGPSKNASQAEEIKKLNVVHERIKDHWIEMKKSLDINVKKVLEVVLEKFYGPNILIHKRTDKLLDYDAATKRLNAAESKCPTNILKDPNQQMVSANQMTNSSLDMALKIKGLKDEQMAAKNNYDALNHQLMEDLPKLVELTLGIFQNCLAAVLKSKKIFIGKSANNILMLLELPLMESTNYTGSYSVQDIQETFHVKYDLVLKDLLADFTLINKNLLLNYNHRNKLCDRKMSKSHEDHKPDSKTVALERNDSLRASTSSNSSGVSGSGPPAAKGLKPPSAAPPQVPFSRPQYSGSVSPYLGSRQQEKSQNISRNLQQVLPQSTNQKENIIRFYSKDQVFIASDDYDAMQSIDLTVRKGDLIGVIKKHNPMGNPSQWFVDNGLTKGLVPQRVLQPVNFHPPTLFKDDDRNGDRNDHSGGPSFGSNQHHVYANQASAETSENTLDLLA